MSHYAQEELTARLLEISEDPSWAGAHRVMAKEAVNQGHAIEPDDLSDDAIKTALFNATAGRLGLGPEFFQ